LPLPAAHAISDFRVFAASRRRLPRRFICCHTLDYFAAPLRFRYDAELFASFFAARFMRLRHV